MAIIYAQFCKIMKTVSFIGILTFVTLIIMSIAIWVANTYNFNIRAMLAGTMAVYIPTILTFIATSKGVEKPQFFWTLFMMSTGFRLFVGLVSIIIVVFQYKKISNEYIGAYFFSYFLLTGFEVYTLMRNLRPISKKESEV